MQPHTLRGVWGMCTSMGSTILYGITQKCGGRSPVTFLFSSLQYLLVRHETRSQGGACSVARSPWTELPWKPLRSMLLDSSA